MITRIALLIQCMLICTLSIAQTIPCNNWLNLPSHPSYVDIGDLDIPGNVVTVEAMINRTATYSGGLLYAGDVVSKHIDYTDVNYLLRPNTAEITTTNGYFRTPDICEIELNKTYHVAMVYDGSTLKFYRDGFLMSQVAATGNLFQNNWHTQVGLYDAIIQNTQFIGYINEVRIWNVARSQAEIRQYMNTSLPSPSTQNGLLAYYTFDNLLNKQGNSTWNGTMGGSATINATNPNCVYTPDSCKNVVANFTTPDAVCVNTPVNITNLSSAATTYYWNFCVADINQAPTGVNLGNPGGYLSGPVFMDYAYTNNNYYAFVTNHSSGNLIRLDFGNSLLNTPTAVNLGNYGGVLQSTSAAEGIQVVQNEGKWYAIIVAGYQPSGTQPKIVKIDFGTSITNPGTATDWGNLGNLSQAIDLHVFKENNNWYGFTVNAENNTITRFNFTNSFDNTPTAVNLGNLGNLNYPTGIYAINDNGFWRVFITNGGAGSSLTRLDFGSSLLNTPTAVNLGNPNNGLHQPRDFTIMKFCGQIIGFAVNGDASYNNIVRLNFNNDITSAPGITTVGNIGNLNFPHSISKLFRVNDDVYTFITNVNNNTITRLRFQGCTNASVSSSSLQNPAPVTYNTPGTYNINLTLDDGLPTQTSYCKQVVVMGPPTVNLGNDTTLCAVNNFVLNAGNAGSTFLWQDGSTAQTFTATTFGQYYVKVTNKGGCSNTDTITLTACKIVTAGFTTPDTVCVNTPVNITNLSSGATTYYWNFCVADINQTPTGVNMGNPGSFLNGPVFMDYVYTNNNYYGFVTNYNTGNLTRLDFGNSLLNTPNAVNLGNYGGIIQPNSAVEGIQVVQNEGKWYAIIVGGNSFAGTQPRIVKIDFGTSITNPGVGTNWGNIGNMNQPIDLHVFKENNNWYGFTVNAENNSITRFNFTNSFDNTPTAIDLGNIGNLAYPTGIYAINDNGFWRVFVVNGGDNQRIGTNSSITRLDFGSSLLNIPTGVNLGNPNNELHHPRDFTIMKFCGQIIGFAVNGNASYNNIVRLNFNNDLTAAPTITTVGNIGTLNFPHSISKLFRVNDDVYTFITNVANNTITRLRFQGCTNASVSSSSLQNPAPVTYNTPGTYNINLTLDDGLPTQTSYCKQVVVMGPPTVNLGNDTTLCAVNNFVLNAGNAGSTFLWQDGSTAQTFTATTFGQYYVKVTNKGGCSNTDTITLTACKIVTVGFTAPDTVCVNAPVTITNTSSGASSYYWTFCTGNLNAPPAGANLGVLNGALTSPVYIDYVQENGNYYGFMTDNYTGNLFRLEFGNSLLNTPVTYNLGDFGSIIPDAAEGIQVIKNEGKWYAIIVGGTLANSTTPRILKIEFGANITNNAPVATNWGNIGNLAYPHDLYVFSDNNGVWYGLTVNSDNSTITRFNFTNSFSNTPTAVNLGNIGTLTGPTGIYALNDNGNWYAFVTNANSSTLTRLDFGNSLLNTPTGTNLGNIGGLFHTSWDIQVIKYCGELLAYVINADQNYNDIIKLNFNNNITGTPTAVSFGNIGNMRFPHCLSKIFRAGTDLYSFIPNVANQTLTRLSFAGCNNASIPNSTAQNPPPVTYNTPGTYNINLTVDDGLPTQTAFCKQVVVLAPPTVKLGNDTALCAVNNFVLDAGNAGSTFLWQDGSTAQTFTATTFGKYYVSVTNAHGCTGTDTIVISTATTAPADFNYKQDICNPLSVQFFSNGTNLTNPYWSFGDGNTTTGSFNPVYTYSNFGDYTVRFGLQNGICIDTITKTIPIRVTYADLILTPDTTICANSTKQLRAKPALSFCWSPSTWLDNPNSPTPVTSTPGKITYYYTAEVAGANIITNGDFASGNTGFTSEYNFATPNITEGQYYVGANPQAWNASLSNCRDHTTGGGNMMLVNGSPAPNVKVWTTTVTVTPNTNYAFSTWIQALYTPNPAQLSFSINGKDVGNLITASLPTCTWSQFYTTWNSGNTTTATISIVNKNTQVQGNDFALDDISFAPVLIQRDSVIISVDTPFVKTNNDTTICKNSLVQLQATGANTWSWTPAAGLSNTAISNPVAKPAATTQYIVAGTTLNGCVAKDTVVITVDAITADFHYKQDICNPQSVQFFADGNNLLNPWWSFGDGNTSGNLNTMNTYALFGNYTVKLGVQNSNCKDTITKIIAVNVTKNNIILTPDTTICINSTKQLRTQPGLSFCWSPSTWLDNPNSPTPITSTPGNITYYYTAEVLGNNLVVNGDFSNGNTGFSSDYTYSTSGLPTGVYFVGNNPTSWHPNMPPCKDHTTGSGNILLVNGAEQANVKVWSQTITVTPNTSYAFSAWLQHVTTINPARLQFSINGNTIGNIFQANSVSCIWDQFYTVWNSGNNTTATISIVNQNTILSGNDFGLDDISFAPISIQRDSVIISVDTPIVKTNNDTTICKNNLVQLQASGANTWSWTPAAGLSNAAINNPVAQPTVNTQYIVTGQTVNGCIAKDTVNIGLYPTPVVLTDHSFLICPNGFVQLSANTGMSSYSWSPATTLNNASIANPVATPLANTLYAVTGKDANNCSYGDSVYVGIRNIRFTASGNQAICQGSSVELKATGGDTYQWTPAASLDDATAANPVATPDANTLYSVYITESSCSHDTTINMYVTINPTPVVTAGKTNDINCTSPTAKLSAGGAISYAWNPVTGLDYPTMPNPVAGIDTTTTYYVKGTNQFGCSAIDSVTVYVMAEGKVTFVVPNAFTPNGDGHNDCFGIKSFGGAVIEEFSIFSRWGERVFTSNNVYKCWDGRYKGNLMEPGGFVYVIKAKTICGTIKRSGVVMLIR